MLKEIDEIEAENRQLKQNIEEERVANAVEKTKIECQIETERDVNDKKVEKWRKFSEKITKELEHEILQNL